MQAMMTPLPGVQRRVVCAAIRRRADGSIIVSPRHYDKLTHEQVKARGSRAAWIGAEEGFVDQFCVFMDRYEALKVAQAAGQLRRRCGGDNRWLSSENLY